MKSLRIVYIFFALLCCGISASAQTTAAYDSLTARYRLRLNGRDLREIVTTISGASTHFQSPTAKAVYNLCQSLLPTITAGTGISVTGTTPNFTVTNTGDTNAADDITTSSTAGGDVSGTFSNLQIATNAVGTSELASTAVTPGTYTNADIIVDADGRVTSAANGSAGFALDTLHINQADHEFLKGQILRVENRVGEKADADSLTANAVVISRTDEDHYIVQLSGITDSLPNVQEGQYYYTSGIKGEATQVPPTKNQLAYKGLKGGRAELVFSDFKSYEKRSDFAYINKVLTTKPDNIVAYYPMNEASGSSLIDIKNGYTGGYSNVTHAEAGFGDGQTSTGLTATNAYVNTNVTGVVTNFNGNEGAIACWIYMSEALLTDGNEHFLLFISNGTSTIIAKKQSTDYQLQLTYRDRQNYYTLQPGWSHIALSWSQRNDRFLTAVNGAPVPNGGGSNNPIQVWTSGALTNFVVGNDAPGSTHSLGGKMAHLAIWNTYLSAGEINRLSALQGVDFTTNPVLKTVSQKMLFKAPSGEANDWLGRASMVAVSSSLWIMVYRSGNDHNDGGGDKQHLRFSNNEGATWSKRDTLLNGTTAVTGFPIAMHATTTNASVGPIIKALNGDLLVHNYEEQPSGHKTYQLRSTDNGTTWTDEGIKFPTNIIAEEDYTIIPSGGNAGLYVIARDFGGGFEETRVYRSTDNGTTWTLRGSPETVIDANECGIEWINGDTLIVVIKTSDQSASYKYYSYDAGATWSSRIDVTDALGEINKPRLTKVGGVLYLHGRQQIRKDDLAWAVLFKSTDDGEHWSQAFNPDSLVQSGDNGYGDILARANGDIYMAYYAGNLGAADIMEYVVRDTSLDLTAAPPLAYYFDEIGVLKSMHEGAPVEIGNVDLTTEVTGVLPPANGGWNMSGLTDNTIPKALGTTNIENSQMVDDGTNVGVNAGATPQAKLHVKKSDVTGNITSVGATIAAEYDADNNVVLLQTNKSKYNSIQFGDQFATGLGSIRYYGTNYSGTPNRMSFLTDGITGTARMTIDSLGKVMIGSSEIPESLLHVYVNNAPQTPNSDASFTIEKGSDDAVMQFLTGTVRASKIYFGDASSQNAGYINYFMSGYSGTGGANRMAFGTNSAEKMSIWPLGGVNVGTGTFTDAAGVLNVTTGFRIANGATSTQYLRGNGTNFVSSAIQAGDLPLIANSGLATMPAHTYKGNNTGSTAAALDLTATELTAELNAFTTSLKGVAPASGGGTTNFLRADGTWAAPAGGSGTVTSVAMTTPSEIATAGSPITSSGTLALSWATQAANLIFSGPSSGIAATPTFRALAVADIPSLDASKITTGTLPVANGGTGLATLTANRIPYGNGTSAYQSSNDLKFDGTQLTLGASSDVARLMVTGTTSASGAYAMRINDAGTASMFLLSNDGQFTVGKAYTFGSDIQWSRFQSGGIITTNTNLSSVESNFQMTQRIDGTGRITFRNGDFTLNTRNSNTGNILWSVYGSSRLDVAAGRATEMRGGVFDANTNDATGGTVAIMNGVQGSVTAKTGVTCTTCRAFEVPDLTNTGTMTNTVGYYVGDITTGTQTNTPLSFQSTDANALQSFMGKTGFGITAPVSVVQAQGTGATSGTYSLIATNSSGTTATAAFTVRDDNKVGIATNAPAEALDINGQARADAYDIRDWSTTDNTNTGELHFETGAGSNAPVLTIGDNSRRFPISTTSYLLQAIDYNTTWTTGRTKAFWIVPAKYNGWYIYRITYGVSSVGTGTNTVDWEIGGTAQTSTNIISGTQYETPDTVISMDDIFTFNVSAIGATPSKGLTVEIELRYH